MSKETTVAKSKFSLVNRVMAILKIGEFGIIENFVVRVEKRLSREISTHKKNIELIKYNLVDSLEKSQDDLEDAQMELEAAKLEINPEFIKTNEQANGYIDTFLSNIEAKRRIVKSIEKHMKDLNKIAEEAIEDTEKAMEFNQELIKDITSKEKS